MSPQGAIDRLSARVRLLTRALGARGPSPDRAGILLAAALVVGLTAIAAAPSPAALGAFAVGRPSPSDIVAPRAITFTSDLLTEERRTVAERAIALVYQARDRAVADAQRARAEAVLRHVALIRANPHATGAEKRTEIAAVPELSHWPSPLVDRLLAVPGDAFAQVGVEVARLVALRMRGTVRPEDVPVAPNNLMGSIAADMDDATAELVAELAAAFIAANTRVDESRTDAARQAARGAVAPELVTLVAGQTIVHEGDPLAPEHLEAMEELGLLRVSHGWSEVIGVFLCLLAVTVVAAGALHRLRPGFWRQTRPTALAVLLVLGFTFGARLVVPQHIVLGFAYPAAAVAMTLTVLFGLETGLVASLVLAVSVGLAGGGSFETAVYVLVASLAGSVVLGRVERLGAFLVAALSVTAASAAVIAAFRLGAPTTDWRAVLELGGAAAVNGVLSAGLAALGALAAGTLFGITTSIQLLELARPDHPLLRQLQLRAPGTYHHSILIGNLAEAAADAIGADVLLVRVAAYYHDVGKSRMPYFFIENQAPGHNPHDALDPLSSARIVVSHVTEGVALAEAHGLPQPVIDAICQHHGTSRVEYFYREAVARAGDAAVDDAPYQYPGPRPRSREMALLMLADGSEAAVRAANPQDPGDVDEVLDRIFRQRLGGGQLDDSDLTLHDLQQVRQAFAAVFRRMYHPRVQYPPGIEPAPVAAGGG